MLIKYSMNFDNFYPAIAKQVSLKVPKKNFDVLHIHFGATGVVTFENHKMILDIKQISKHLLVILYFDAEPMEEIMIKETAKKLSDLQASRPTIYKTSNYIIATSDSNHAHIQDFLDNIDSYRVQNKNSKSTANTWYYFFHGFVALDWFREYEFYDVDTIIANKNFKYNYITMNRLVEGTRNYRLCLMSRLEEKKLTKHALVSYSPYTGDISVPGSELERVTTYCSKAKRFDLEGDVIPNDSMHINIDTHMSSFFHIVTETCYYQNFNHLTEKVFKPIVMLQPFILAGTVGSLRYLKRYGFKTFNKWIDESYDKIEHPYKRLDAITLEVEKICALSKEEQESMFKEMLPTLIHNRHHFYGKFYSVLHKEMWENFRLALPQT